MNIIIFPKVLRCVFFGKKSFPSGGSRQQLNLPEERQKFGRFYYRFPNGEAGTDVFDRVSDFWSTLLRSMDTSPVENLVSLSGDQEVQKKQQTAGKMEMKSPKSGIVMVNHLSFFVLK